MKIKRKIGEDVSRSLLVSPITSVSEAVEEDKNIATTILKNAPKVSGNYIEIKRFVND